ncbi:Uncharacterised protein [Yersinia pseudotuberculosis]|nr:Uncharacterised protein [Yersinia bercovieri]CNL39382.1 Uncharacterised protein [Yersinia pseudotuberculosis]CNM02712.1 Uncharacterised protein [Yersinia intermedia]CQJ05709.1 Uncharacterised protein [Yersinia frederiksenii]SUB29248.1 Uncharacterised protein [Yersinia pseudotuberculosis]
MVSTMTLGDHDTVAIWGIEVMPSLVSVDYIQ